MPFVGSKLKEASYTLKEAPYTLKEAPYTLKDWFGLVCVV